MADREQKEYVRPSKGGEYVCLSAAVRAALGDRANLYENENGSVLALVSDAAGQLEVTDIRIAGRLRRVICSRVLASRLRVLQTGATGHVPARVDAKANALLLGETEPGAAFSAEKFFPLDLRHIRCLSCQVTPEFLRVKRALKVRSEALCREEALAFVSYSDGSVVLEPDGESYLIRKPEVVAFAREHWYERRLYFRKLEGATVVTPELRALCTLQSLEGFVPLEMERTLRVELDRYYRQWVSPGVVSALGQNLSVYACGPYLALGADPEGDIQVRQEEGGGSYLSSQRLSQQLAMRFLGQDRLFLASHGDLLVFSEEEKPDRRDWPPADYFCRMLMERRKTSPLMKYGVYRPVAPEPAGI